MAITHDHIQKIFGATQFTRQEARNILLQLQTHGYPTIFGVEPQVVQRGFFNFFSILASTGPETLDYPQQKYRPRSTKKGPGNHYGGQNTAMPLRKRS